MVGITLERIFAEYPSIYNFSADSHNRGHMWIKVKERKNVV